MSKPKEKPPAATEGSNKNITCSQGSDAAAASQPLAEKIWNDDETAAATSVPPEPVQAPSAPRDLMPPGLVGEVAQYIYASSVRPVREIALGAALGLVAGIAGRAYNVNGTGLNQYLLLVAKTGTGKEDGPKGVERLLAALRPSVPMIDEFVGPGAFASGQGLIRALDKQPSILCMLGEIGITLQTIVDPRASTSTKLLLRALLDLYSRSGWKDVLRSTAYSDSEKDTKTVFAPALSFIGDTTPESLYDWLSPKEIASGLLPRMTVIEYKGTRPGRNLASGEPPDAPLLDHLAALAQSALTMRNDSRNMPVPMDAAGAVILNAYDEECDERMRATTAGAVENQLLNRAHLKALKVAALLAVGVNHHQPSISAQLATWAVNFTRWTTREVLSRFEMGEIGTGEVRQEFELKRIAREYFRLPSRERQRYGVPKKLADQIGFLSVGYVRRRAARLSCFKEDRRDFNVAFRSTLQALCEAGWLFKLSPQDKAKLGFDARMGDVYGLGAQVD